MRLGVFLWVGALVSGCGASTMLAAGDGTDSAVAADTGVGVIPVDAGLLDAGSPDVESPDAGVSVVGAGPFLGTYAGTAVVMLTVSSGPAMASSTPMMFTVADAPSGSRADMTVTFGSSGDMVSTCTLTARRVGNAASLTPGQSCVVPSSSGGPSVRLTLQGGTATVTGSTLQVTLTMTAAELLGGAPVMVSLQVNFNGVRN